MITNKVTLIIEDSFLQEIVTKLIPFAEADEICEIIDIQDVDVCEDCKKYVTPAGEIVMDSFNCDALDGFCMNCCGCGEHEGKTWY